MQVQSLGEKDPLEEEMATNSSILARIPWDCKESDSCDSSLKMKLVSRVDQ